MRLLVLLTVLWLALPAVAHARPDGTRPNVLVIETDDQTQADMASMPLTRHLIGDKGVTFDDSIVSLSECCPSRATVLTGQYAHNHRVLNTQPPFGGFPAFDDQESLAVWLQRAGYTTGIVGKYFNKYGKDDPTYVPPGWDDWHVLLGPSVYRYFGFTMNEDGRLRSYDKGQYQTDVLTQTAADVIRRRAKGDKPFFLWTTYVAPHVGTPKDLFDPPGMETTVPSPLFAATFAAALLPKPLGFNEADVSDKPAFIRDRPRLNRYRFGLVQQAWRQRQQALQSVDHGVVRLLRTLRETGQLDDTLILFTSDNGFLEGQHRVPGGKVLPYEPSIRVPLLMRGPGVPAGVHRGGLVANVDLAPTILEAAGARSAWPVDGESLFPVAAGTADDADRAVLLEGPPISNHDATLDFTGLRTPRYAYVEYHTGEVELYDLQRDPGELDNLAADPSSAGVREAFARRLARLRDCAGAACRR